jgi:hypothetical protein
MAIGQLEGTGEGGSLPADVNVNTPSFLSLPPSLLSPSLLSIHPSIHPSIYLSTYLHIHLSDSQRNRSCHSRLSFSFSLSSLDPQSTLLSLAYCPSLLPLPYPPPSVSLSPSKPVTSLSSLLPLNLLLLPSPHISLSLFNACMHKYTYIHTYTHTYGKAHACSTPHTKPKPQTPNRRAQIVRDITIYKQCADGEWQERRCVLTTGELLLVRKGKNSAADCIPLHEVTKVQKLENVGGAMQALVLRGKFTSMGMGSSSTTMKMEHQVVEHPRHENGSPGVIGSMLASF